MYSPCKSLKKLALGLKIPVKFKHMHLKQFEVLYFLAKLGINMSIVFVNFLSVLKKYRQSIEYMDNVGILVASQHIHYSGL